MWPSSKPSQIATRRNATWLARGLEQLNTLVENVCAGTWVLVAAKSQRQP